MAIWEITASASGRRISYRQVMFTGTTCAGDPVTGTTQPGICLFTSDAGKGEERWELSEIGELVITRQAEAGARLVHQRLVLEPSVLLPE